MDVKLDGGADETATLEKPLLSSHETEIEDKQGGQKRSVFGDIGLFPSSVKYLVWNEFCERFSFYGMKTILALFLLERVRLSEIQATEVVHLFIVACYATPLLGALLSDCYLGKYSTILYLSLVYSVGNWVMAIAAAPSVSEASMFPLWCTMLALGLIAFGTGGIKPCVSAFGGDQIEWSLPDGEPKNRLRRKFFSLYYFAINAGSFISTILTPLLREDMSYATAFAVPALLMIMAVFIFWVGRQSYVDRPPEGNIFPVVGRVTADAFRLQKVKEAADVETDKGICIEPKHWLDSAKLKHDEIVVEDVKTLLQVLVVLLPAPLFWALFDQQSSKWVFQAREMNGHVSWLGGLVIQPDQMQAVNPVLILVMIPLFDQVVYPLLEKLGLSLRPIQRMLAGMLLCALAFLMSGFLQLAIDSSASTTSDVASPTSLFLHIGAERQQVSVLWQIPQYVLMTSGEILFSITGLEFAYSQAPNSMKSVVQSFWLLTVAAGNLVTVLIVAVIGGKLTKANEFFFFSGGCAFAMLLMVWLGSGFKYKSTLTTVQVGKDQAEDA
ncbi:hypothetical protein GOP47_0026704 [Adiantum capillus-veneris]|nr:hypothetical protein GOP47_0026704 [Adiantum capillus-veneris]